MRRQNHCFYYLLRRPIVVLLCIMIFFLPFFIYKTGSDNLLKNFYIESTDYDEYNEWKELIIPQGTDFNENNQNHVLDRTKYSIELLHYLGLNSSVINSFELYDNVILLFGSQSVIGNELIQSIENSQKGKKFLLIKIRSIVDIDFTSSDSFLLFQHLRSKITKAVIIYQPLYLFENSEKDGSSRIEEMVKYELNGIQNFLNQMDIQGVFIIPPPHFKIYETILAKSNIIFTPHLIDTQNVQDCKNLLNKIIFQCKMAQKTEIVHYKNNEYNDFLSILPIDKIINLIINDFLIENKFNFGEKKLLTSDKQIEINDRKFKQMIEKIMNDEYKTGCQIEQKMSPHESIEFIDYSKINKIELNDIDHDLNSKIQKSIQNLYYITNPTYLSIVFTGRNDDYGKGFIDRAKYFLNYLHQTITNLSNIVNIEVIIVDYATDESRDPFHSLFDDFLNGLKSDFPFKNEIKIRFIQVPHKFHQKLTEAKVPFLEYIAKNIGIRRAKGDFVLSMNPDSLLSRNFFELVSNKLFNPGFLYTSTRVDMDEEDSEDKQKKEKFIHMIFEEPGITSYNSPLNPLNKHKQKIKNNHFNKMEYIKINFNYDWGFGDFQMLSKKMWKAVNGFSQFPTNTYVDNLLFAKMLKNRPGSFSMNLPTPIIHQYHTHVSSKRPHNIDLINNSMIEYEMFGRIGKAGEKTDVENWGYPYEYFPETIYVI